MFYSHQLLARKAPLGQIWMAATMHAKIHRRKLDKLNIIKICEEILNPSVPMALRLSGILMGGVVIVYERKVKLLYDDVTRLLVEINEAWKVKSVPSDPTRLPKGKSQAKYESVTLPPNRNEDLGEIEELLQYSDTATIMNFQQTSYFAMRLDNVDDPYLNQNLQGDQEQNHHQAEAANITIIDNYDSFQADTTTFNHFERFDVEGDDQTQLNFTPPENDVIPNCIPSPPRQEELPKSNEGHEQYHEEPMKQQSAESKEANPGRKRKMITRRRARKPTALTMDNDETIITGHVYQSWLQNSSDIVRERNIERPRDAMSMMKISSVMDLPSVVLMERLFTNGHLQIHYPTPLFEMWIRSIQPPHDSPSGGASHPQPPEPSLSSPPDGTHHTVSSRDHFGDFHGGVGSLSPGVSIEKQRANGHHTEMPPEILMEELRNNLKNNGVGVGDANGVSASKVNVMETPANSGDEIKSIPSSGSAQGLFSHNLEVNSGRSGKKRKFSASKNSGNGLEPVEEDLSWENSDPPSKLAKPSNYEFTADYDLLVETGPTQTQKRSVINQPLDQITDSIRAHLKTHFDTVGSSEVESLNQLAYGMNKKRAACLFYQTCVLATRDYIRVDQKVPYGDILISRGAKM